MYIGYALVFLQIAGLEAVLIRLQLAVPQNSLVSPQVLIAFFTMHGTTMVPFVGMPILFGFGNYLILLMLGASDMAFPRLNAFSFWIAAFGGLLLYSVFGGDGLLRRRLSTDVGWFAYAPLTARVFTRAQYRLLDPGCLAQRYWLHRYRLNIVTTIISMCVLPGYDAGAACLCWCGFYFVTCCMVFVAVSPPTGPPRSCF